MSLPVFFSFRDSMGGSGSGRSSSVAHDKLRDIQFSPWCRVTGDQEG
jgi:hypothetical protein